MEENENSLRIKLSDTINVTSLNNLTVAKLTDFELYGVVRIGNYKLKRAMDQIVE